MLTQFMSNQNRLIAKTSLCVLNVYHTVNKIAQKKLYGRGKMATKEVIEYTTKFGKFLFTKLSKRLASGIVGFETINLQYTIDELHNVANSIKSVATNSQTMATDLYEFVTQQKRDVRLKTDTTKPNYSLEDVKTSLLKNYNDKVLSMKSDKAKHLITIGIQENLFINDVDKTALMSFVSELQKPQL